MRRRFDRDEPRPIWSGLAATLFWTGLMTGLFALGTQVGRIVAATEVQGDVLLDIASVCADALSRK